jgi:hypothetical protein
VIQPNRVGKRKGSGKKAVLGSRSKKKKVQALLVPDVIAKILAVVRFGLVGGGFVNYNRCQWVGYEEVNTQTWEPMENLPLKDKDCMLRLMTDYGTLRDSMEASAMMTFAKPKGCAWPTSSRLAEGEESTGVLELEVRGGEWCRVMGVGVAKVTEVPVAVVVENKGKGKGKKGRGKGKKGNKGKNKRKKKIMTVEEEEAANKKKAEKKAKQEAKRKRVHDQKMVAIRDRYDAVETAAEVNEYEQTRLDRIELLKDKFIEFGIDKAKKDVDSAMGKKQAKTKRRAKKARKKKKEPVVRSTMRRRSAGTGGGGGTEVADAKVEDVPSERKDTVRQIL